MQIEFPLCLTETSSRKKSENSMSVLQSAKGFYGWDFHNDGSVTNGDGGCLVVAVVRLSRNV